MIFGAFAVVVADFTADIVNTKKVADALITVAGIAFNFCFCQGCWFVTTGRDDQQSGQRHRH